MAEEKSQGQSRFFNGDAIFLFCCLCFSIAMIISANYLRDASGVLVPRLFGMLAVIFSLLALIIRAIAFFRGGELKRATLASAPAMQEGAEIEGAMHLPTAIALAVAYVVLGELIGFIVSTVVIVFAYLWFAQYRRVLFGIVFSVLVALILYGLFYTLLQVNLPAGYIPWPWQRFIQ